MHHLLRDERGETLVETLITMMIVALAVVGLLGGLATATSSSAQHRKLAKAEVLVRDAAEQLKDRTTPFHAGCSVVAYDAIVSTMSQWDDFHIEVVEVLHWEPGTNSPASFSTSNCATAIQRITLEATSDDGDVSERVQIIKASLS